MATDITLDDELRKNIYVDASFGANGEGIPENATAADGTPLIWGVNAFDSFSNANNALVSGGTLHVSNCNESINTYGKIVNLVVMDSRINELNTGMTGMNNSSDGDISLIIDNTTFGLSGESYLVCKGDDYNAPNTLNGNVHITVTNSTIGPGTTWLGLGNTVFGAKFLRFTGDEYVFEVSDSAILSNLLTYGDSDPIAADQTVVFNLTNVTGTEDVYWCVIDGGQPHAGDIVVSMTGASVTASGLRLGTQGTWSYIPTCTSNISFNVQDSYFNGLLTAHSVDRDHNCNFSGNKVLNITGGSNYVREILHFSEVNLSAGATLSGSTMILDNAKLNIDATGCEGPSRTLIYMSDTLSGVDGEINVTGLDGSGYTLVKGSRAVVLSDGSIGNLYYDKNFTSSVTGRTAESGDILIFSGDTDNPAIENAMTDFNTAREKLATLSSDKKLFATLNSSLFGENNTLYATLADADVTPFVNLVVTGGRFTGDDATIAVAAEGKTVTGDATIELAGKVFNFSEIVFEGIIDGQGTFKFSGDKITYEHLNYDYPVNVTINGEAWNDLNTPFDLGFTPDYSGAEIIEKTGRNTISFTSNENGLDLYFDDYESDRDNYRVSFTVGTGGNDFIGTIDGSKDSVGGVSRLVVSEDAEVGSIRDFDIVDVNANLTVGDLDARDVSIEVDSTLTVNGALSSGSTIHLVIDGVTGAGNLVLTATGLSELLAGGLTLDFDESAGVIVHAAGSDDLWFMPFDYTGNVYVDASFTDAISGTFRNGDLLYFGVNAFDSLQAAIEKQNNILTLYVSGGSFEFPVVLDGFDMEISGGAVDGITVKPSSLLLVAEGGTATGIVEKGGRVEVAEGAIAQFVPGEADDLVISSYTATAHSGTVLNRPVLEQGGEIEVFDGGVLNSPVFQSKDVQITVLSGGAANDVSLDNGDAIRISAGGVVNNAVLRQGEYSVSSGVVLNNTTVKDYGASFKVFSGGVVNNTIISGHQQKNDWGGVDFYRGTMTVYEGGIANDTIVDLGAVTISSGGMANDTTVNEGGLFIVSKGGVANDITADKGEIHIFSGQADDIMLNGGGLYVRDGGIVNDVAGNNGGRVNLYSNTVLNSGTFDHFTLEVTDGAEANNITASACEIALNGNGGKLYGATITEGGFYSYNNSIIENVTFIRANWVWLYNQTTMSNATISGCNLYLESGVIDGATIFDGGIDLYSNGTANDVTLNGGNLQFVHGTGSGATINNGCFNIYDNGRASDVTLNGGETWIQERGTLNSATVNAGRLYVYANATATDIVENGGWVDVENGAIVTFQTNTFDGLTLGESRSATVHEGTTATNTTLNNGGRFAVFSGGTAENTTINTWDGLSMENGATFINTLINENAQMTVVTGATISGATVNANARLEISSGAVASDIEEKGGWVEVQEGADAGFKAENSFSDLTLSTNQSATVHTGTTAHNTTITGGYLAVIGGVADNTVVSGIVEKYEWWEDVHSGSIMVDKGGTIQGTTVYDYSEVRVSAGARATNTTVTSGGRLDIFEDGNADGVVVSRGGSLNIDRAADVTGVKVMNSGYLAMTVDSGTNVAGTFAGSAFRIENGAVAGFEANGMKSLTLLDGGTAENAIVTSEGMIRVSSGGTAAGATVNENGQMDVSSNGTVTGGTVNNGGGMYVAESGMAADLTVKNGGKITIEGGANVTGLSLEDGARLEMTLADRTYVAGTSGGSAFEAKDGRLDHFSMNNGWLTISDGCVATDLSLEGGVEMTVSGGTVNGLIMRNYGWWNGVSIDRGVLTGQIAVSEGQIRFRNDGAILFNVSDLTPDMEDTTRISDYSRIQNSPLLLATVSEAQMRGSYILARNAGNFKSYITVYTEDGTFLEEINLGDNQIEYAGKTYTLNLTDDVLTLDVETVRPVISLTCDNTTPLQETTLTATSEPGAEIWFSTDNKNWSAYENEITVIENATYYFKALDGEGNIGTNWIKIGNVDRIPPEAPVVTPSILTDTLGIVNVSAEFSEDSALKEYSFDNETWMTYDGAITFAENGTVHFRATDAAGNVSETVRYDVTNILDDELRKNVFVDAAFGGSGENIVEGSTSAIGSRLVWGVNAFSDLADAIEALIPGQTFYINDYNGVIDFGSKYPANLVVTGKSTVNIKRDYGQSESSASISEPYSITFDGSALVGGGGAGSSGLYALLGKGASSDHLVYSGPITINLLNGGASESLLFFGSNTDVLDDVTLNIKDWTLNGDFLPFSAAGVVFGSENKKTKLVWNWENVTLPASKWFTMLSSIGQSNLEEIVFNVKNSSLRGGDTRICAFRETGNSGSDANITFTVEDTYLEGRLVAGSLSNSASTTRGTATLNIRGSSNHVGYATSFHVLNLTADTYLSGNEFSFRDTGTINIDLTGYTGPSKFLVELSSGFQQGDTSAGITLNVIGENASDYQVLFTDKTIILKGAPDDIYVNGNYTAQNIALGTMYNGDILFFNENAFSSLEAGKSALTPGNRLYITGGSFGSITCIAEEADSAESVDLVVSGASISGITVAPEGKTVTGDATIELAGFFGADAQEIVLEGIIDGQGMFRFRGNQIYYDHYGCDYPAGITINGEAWNDLNTPFDLGFIPDYSFALENAEKTGRNTIELSLNSEGLDLYFDDYDGDRDRYRVVFHVPDEGSDSTNKNCFVDGSKESVGGVSRLLVSKASSIGGGIHDFDVVDVNASLFVSGGFEADAVTVNASLFVSGGFEADAVTVNASLFVSGGFEADTVTVKEDARLSLACGAPITIDGDIVNNGTLFISADGLVDGTQLEVTALTANSITGDGVFATDSDSYTVQLVGNEVHLIQKTRDVAIRSSWGTDGYEPGWYVDGWYYTVNDNGEITDNRWWTGTYGVDGFATLEEAMQSVSIKGSIYVFDSDVTFSDPVTHNVIGGGSTVIRNAHVTAGNTITLFSGATLVANGLEIDEGASVIYENNSSHFDFDLTALTPGSGSEPDLSRIYGSPIYRISLASDQALGEYVLATAPADFSGNFELCVDGYGTGVWLSTANGNIFSQYGERLYSLYLDESGKLVFTCTTDEEAPVLSDIRADISVPTVGSVTVTATIADNYQLSSVYYRIGENGNWEYYWGDYSSGVSITVYDNTTVSFKATDSFGNESGIASYEVTNIDRTAPARPEVSADVTELTNGDVLVSATFGEETSVKEYSPDNMNWQPYTEPILFTENGTVYFRETDAAGNISESAAYDVTNIDKTAPATPVAFADVTEPTNGNVLVSATFSEDNSVKEYSLDNQNWQPYTEPILFTENGTVSFRETDAAGNVSQTAAFEVGNINRVAPVISESSFSQGDGNYIFTANVTATDDLSNAEALKYFIRYADSVEALPYAEATAGLQFTLGPAEAGRMLYYQAGVEDEAGNVTWTDARSFVVNDYTAPELNEVTAEFVNRMVLVTWDASDNIGVAGYSLTLNDRTYELRDSFFVLDNVTAGDYTYQVTAYDEAGNATTGEQKTLTVEQRPDLYFRSVEIRTKKADGSVSTATTISVTDDAELLIKVGNMGDVASAQSSVSVLFGDGTDVRLDTTVASVMVGSEEYCVVPIKGRMSTGIQEIRVVLDEKNSLPEYDDSNNERSLTLNVENKILGDLVIGSVHLDKTVCPASENAVLTFTVKNIGYDVIAGSKAYIFDGENKIGEVDVASVRIGEETDALTCTIAAKDLTPGSHAIRIEANADNAVSENNLKNNSAQVQLTVGFCDLGISRLFLSKDAVNTEESVTVNFTVRNSGTDTAAASVAGIYAGDRKLGAVEIGELSGGLSVSRQFVFSANDLPAGLYNLRVVADDGNAVIESDKTNNSRGINLQVIQKDERAPEFSEISIRQGENDYTFHITASAEDDFTDEENLVYSIRYADTREDLETADILDGTEFSLTPEHAGKTLYYQVSATDLAGNTTWCLARKFTAADHTAPEIGDISVSVTDSILTLSWDATDNVGVTSYKVYRVVEEGEDELVQESDSNTMESVSTGSHTYRIEAYDAAGNMSRPKNVKVNFNDTVRPVIESAGAVQSADGYGIAFEVTASDNQTPASDLVGRVQYAFAAEDVQNAPLSGLNLALTPADAGRTLYYRVSAIDEAGNTAWSDIRSLVVADVTAPDIPTELSGVVDGSGVTLNWTASADNAGVTGYQVRYGLTENLSGEGTAVAGNQYTLTSLKEGVYYWQAAAVDAAGNISGWSEVRSFRILPEDIFAPNGTAEQAFDIGQLSDEQFWTGGAIASADDADWFKFTLNSRGTANDYIRIDFDGDYGDLDLYLYSSNGTTQLLSSDTIGGDMEKVSLKDLQKGTYLLKVAGRDGAMNTFSLFTKKIAGYEMDEYDANSRNDSTEAATVFDLEKMPQATVSGLNLHETGDADYYQFSLSNMGLEGDSVSISFENSVGDLDLFLFDSQGVKVAESCGTENVETISFNGLAAGTYYIQVSAANNAVNEYSLNWTITSNKVEADWLEGMEPYELSETTELTALSIGAAGDGITQEDAFILTLNQPGSATSKIRFSNYRSDWEGLKYVIRAADDTVVLSGIGSEISLDGLDAGSYSLTVDAPVAGSFSSYDISVSLPETAGTKWTYMVYMAADNNLDTYALYDLISMQQASLDSQIDIYVLVDRNQTTLADLLTLGSKYKWDSVWSDTRVGKITYSPGKTVTVDWESWGELDTSSITTLERFVDWTQNQSNAGNYGLVMWDHGMENGSLCVDGTTDAGWETSLSVSEVSALLREKGNVPIVIFNNCLLGSENVAAQMNGSTEVIVVSEAESYPQGTTFAYKEFFSTITSDMTAQEMAEVLVRNVGQKGDGSSPSMLSAVDVTDSRLATALENLAAAVTGAGNSADKSVLINALAQARQDNCAYDGSMVYQSDLYDAVLRAMEDRNYSATSDGFKDALASLKSTLEDVVILSKTMPVNRGYGIATFNPVLTVQKYLSRLYSNETVNTFIQMYLDSYYTESTRQWAGLLYDVATAYQKQLSPNASFKAASFSVSSIVDLGEEGLVSFKDLGCFSGQGAVFDGIDLIDELHFGIAITSGTTSTGGFAIANDIGTDVRISVFSEDGELVAGGTNGVSFTNLAAGDYHILLQSDEACKITLSFEADWMTGVDRFDYAQSKVNEKNANGNGSITKANDLSVGYYSGLLTCQGDSDLYRIGNVYTETYQIVVEGAAGMIVEERDRNNNVIQTAKFANGAYTMTVQAMNYLFVEGSADLAQNQVDAYSVSISNIQAGSDITPPTKPVASADVTAATNGDVLVSAVFSDDSVVKEYSLDGENWLAYTEAIKFTDNGSVFFRGIDEAGNVSDVTNFLVNNIDKVAPVKPTASADVTSATNDDVLVSAVFSDDSVVKEYSLDGENWLAYTAAIRFMENGTVFFRGKDAVGNVSEVEGYTVSNISRVAPDKPVATVDVTVPTNAAVHVSAVFNEDSVSNEYSLNGTDWFTYTGSIEFTDNGTVYFRSTDSAGNVSEVTTFEVANIDKVAPEAPSASADVTTATNGDVLVSAQFSDDSAVREYSLDGQNWLAYTEPVTMTENGTVRFRGADEAGNVSEVANFLVSNIDKVAPEAPAASADVTALTNGNVLVSAVFSDDSVVKEYSLDGQTWLAYTEPVTMTENGTVRFRGADEAGNVSEVANFLVSNIDKVAPTAPVASADVTTATNGNVTVTAQFSEDSVTREYSLDGETWQTYDAGGVIIIINGTVFFRGTDAAENVSEITAYEVTNIDKEAPAAPVASADITTNTNGNVLVSAQFSDDSAVREYSLDGQNWLAYTTPVSFTENGSVFFRGTDAAGNVSEVTNFLVSNIVIPDNKPDTRQDDFLSRNGKWNDANIKVSNKISGEKEVHLDAEGTVSHNDKHNMFGNDGTNKDAGDVAKIEVEDTSKLTFTIDSTAAGTFYVYEKVDKGNDKYKQVTVGKATVKAGNPANLDVFLSDTGSYYVAMVAKSTKKGTSGYYNVNVTGYNSSLFEDSDKGGNDKYGDATPIEIGRGNPKELFLDSDKSNFVGFTDIRDYAKLDLASSAYMSFDLKSDGKAKFTLWKQKIGSNSNPTKVTSKSLSAKSSYKGTTAAVFLDTSKYVYYISMESTDAAKGASTHYSVSVKSPVFFDSADNDLINGSVYDKKKNLNTRLSEFRTNDITVSGEKELFLDSNEIKQEGFSNFVGYNDKADYAKFNLAADGNVTFTISTTGAGTFAIYRNNEAKKKLEVIKKVEIKTNANSGELSVSGLAAGDYFISMTAKNTKANDKGSVFYNVTANATLSGNNSDALAMPELSDSLAMTDSLSFASFDADALASATASAHLDSVADKLFGESGRGILA